MTFEGPTRAEQWPSVGDTCESVGGMFGEVLRIREYQNGGPAAATVRWENGFTGRVSITNLRRVDEPRELHSYAIYGADH